MAQRKRDGKDRRGKERKEIRIRICRQHRDKLRKREGSRLHSVCLAAAATAHIRTIQCASPAASFSFSRSLLQLVMLSCVMLLMHEDEAASAAATVVAVDEEEERRRRFPFSCSALLQLSSSLPRFLPRSCLHCCRRRSSALHCAAAGPASLRLISESIDAGEEERTRDGKGRVNDAGD